MPTKNVCSGSGKTETVKSFDVKVEGGKRRDLRSKRATSKDPLQVTQLPTDIRIISELRDITRQRTQSKPRRLKGKALTFKSNQKQY